MAEEHIENITTWDSNFAPALINYYWFPHGHCLINNDNNSSNIINLYIYYKLFQF